MKSKHNYNGEDFYKLIESLARIGFTDKEIAERLNIDSKTFSKMKNGHCHFWTQEQNRTRSERIVAALSKGRTEIVALMRVAYLRVALGGKMLKSVVKEYIVSVDTDGNPTGGRVLHGMTERETELPPNMKALSKWLYHFDADWRNSENERKSHRAKMLYGDNQDVDTWLIRNTTIHQKEK